MKAFVGLAASARSLPAPMVDLDITASPRLPLTEGFYHDRRLVGSVDLIFRKDGIWVMGIAADACVPEPWQFSLATYTAEGWPNSRISVVEVTIIHFEPGDDPAKQARVFKFPGGG